MTDGPPLSEATVGVIVVGLFIIGLSIAIFGSEEMFFNSCVCCGILLFGAPFLQLSGALDNND